MNRIIYMEKSMWSAGPATEPPSTRSASTVCPTASWASMPERKPPNTTVLAGRWSSPRIPWRRSSVPRTAVTGISVPPGAMCTSSWAQSPPPAAPWSSSIPRASCRSAGRSPCCAYSPGGCPPGSIPRPGRGCPRHGYYLLDTTNGQADTTGEFMFGVSMGYEIKKGKLGRALLDTTISGVLVVQIYG